MQKWLQDFLGITEIRNRLRRISHDTEGLSSRITNLERTLLPGLGRVIAKLDPLYGVPEDDPARVAESKDLGEQAIRRIKAEAMARDHTEGKL